MEYLFSNFGKSFNKLYISHIAVPFSTIISYLSESLKAIVVSSDCPVAKEDLALLGKQCPNLEDLKINDCCLDDLSCLSFFKKLKMFSISSEVIHLETLPTLPLEHLSLSAKKLTGCPSLVRFKSTLKKLRVTRISF